MRNLGKSAVLAVVVLGLIAFTGGAIAGPAKANKPERAMEPQPVEVPDGMMAIILPGGRSYTLVPGSPDDLMLAADGVTVLRSRTPRGAQILGAAKNAFIAAETEPLPDKPSCDGNFECGYLTQSPINPSRLTCSPAFCSNCSYWHEVCTGK